uniref:Putative DNA binding, helix-turn-helix domain containing protein n=1 Tax=viral metagenome TaxID=1070528 RepID=A0A6M3JJZ9_9ZZZZ
MYTLGHMAMEGYMENAIKHYRAKHRPPISQAQLARLLGIDRPLLSKMENDKARPTPGQLELMARMFGVPPTCIILKDNEEN